MQIDARDDSGKTALLWAAAHGQAKIVELLLEQGTAVGEADSYGGTGLMKVSIAQCALLRCTQETARLIHLILCPDVCGRLPSAIKLTS